MVVPWGHLHCPMCKYMRTVVVAGEDVDIYRCENEGVVLYIARYGKESDALLMCTRRSLMELRMERAAGLWKVLAELAADERLESS